MTVIVLEQFQGVAPRVAPRLLHRFQAQVATNCNLYAGALRPWNQPRAEAQAVKANARSLYRYRAGVWFHWAGDVDVVSAPVYNVAAERVYFTGDGPPKLTFNTLATQNKPAGVATGAYPYGAYLLGLPAPEAPSYAQVLGNSGTIKAAVSDAYHARLKAASDPAATLTKTMTVNGDTELNAVLDASVNATADNTLQIAAHFTITRDGSVIASKDTNFAVYGTQKRNAYNGVREKISFRDRPPAGSHTYVFNASWQITDHQFELGPDVKIDKFLTAAITTGATSVTLDRTDHQLNPGDRIRIRNVAGMSMLNGTFTVLAVDGATVTLNLGTEQTYTGGGAWTQVYTADGQSTSDAAVTRAYLTTLVSDLQDGSGLVQEGPPSLPTPLKAVAPGATVKLDIPKAPADPAAGSYHISGQNLWRLVTDNTGHAVYRLVNTTPLPVAGNTFADTVTETVLAEREALPSEGWIAPPADLKGLIALPGGALAGFHTNELCFSVPEQPHAWPIAYRETTHKPIVGLGAYGSSVLVMTEGRPYVVTGPEPGATSIEWLELAEPCLSKRGSVDMGYAILYPAPAGLMLIAQGREEIITGDLFKEHEWAALNPASFIAARAQEKYVCFYTNAAGAGGFVLDTREPEAKLTFLDLDAVGAWSDPGDGALYLIDSSGQISQWNAGATPLTYTWRSKRFVARRLLNFGAAQIHAEAYPLTFRLYALLDGRMRLKFEHQASDSTPFRLPSGYRSDQWEVELTGTVQVNAVYLAEGLNELRAAA